MASRYENSRRTAGRKRDRSSPWLWIMLGTILVLGLLLLIDFIGDYTSVGPFEGATIREIVQAPDTYIGQNVTVSGEVNTVIGQRAFTIGDEEFMGGAELLVVSVNDLPTVDGWAADTSILENDIVQVAGPVRRFEREAFENAVGVDLDDAALEPFNGQPAIIAQSVDLTPRAGAVEE